MKSLFKFLFIFCIAFTTLTFAQDFSFPKYSDNMKNVSACSCTGVFSSCSGSGSCNCSCGYFSCSCSSSPEKIEKISQIDISISRKQFGHIEELAKKLYQIKANKVLTHLSNMMESVKKSDLKSFKSSRENYIKELNELDVKSKEYLNEFFSRVGALERI